MLHKTSGVGGMQNSASQLVAAIKRHYIAHSLPPLEKKAAARRLVISTARPIQPCGRSAVVYALPSGVAAGLLPRRTASYVPRKASKNIYSSTSSFQLQPWLSCCFHWGHLATMGLWRKTIGGV